MKKTLVILGVLLFLLFNVISANALNITTSASGNSFDDSYAYEFTIENTPSPLIYHASLENKSYASAIGALIDALAFNILATLGDDFTIINVVPNWIFAEGSNGMQFDYVGKADKPGDKLAPGDKLSFDFSFVGGYAFPEDPFSLWTQAPATAGTSIGGGDDFGQVAVSFQQLGSLGKESDLLASNWEGAPVAPVPEPATMILLGTGLIGLAGFIRKKI